MKTLKLDDRDRELLIDALMDLEEALEDSYAKPENLKDTKRRVRRLIESLVGLGRVP